MRVGLLMTILLVFNNLFCFGQRLTLTDLIGLCNKKNWEDVNQVLLSKGWTYYDSEKGDTYKYNTITWSFNKEYYEDKAQAWFHLYTYEGFPNKIAYYVFNKSSYSLIQNTIVSAGFKLTNSKIEDNELVSSYANANYILIINTEKRNDDEWIDRSLTAYNITLIKKESIYDSQNGKKTDYYEGGQLMAEYFLRNDNIHGKFKYYYENGNLKREGTYINGLENGKFIEYDENGIKTTEYSMINGKENGNLIIYQDGLKVQEITKLNGVTYGKVVTYFYDEYGSLYSKLQGNIIDEKKDGLWETFLISNDKEELLQYTTFSLDVKNGSFKHYISSDTLEIGMYKNGLLDGQFQRKTKLKLYLKDDTSSEVVHWNVESEGNYNNGFKDGKWIYYSLGNKSEEGYYKLGKKNGKWITYVTMGNYSGEIQQEIEYKYGKEDGICKRYYDLTFERDTTSEYPGLKFVNVPIQELHYYKDGLKDGDYTLKDSTGILISSGAYSSDKKTGLWIESYLLEKSNNNNIRIYQKGAYLLDQRNGIWHEYADENIILESYNFKNGLLDGVTTKYNIYNRPEKVYEFSNGELKNLDLYDSLGLNITCRFKINARNGNLINCNFTDYRGDFYIIQGYEFVSSFTDYNPFQIDIDFFTTVADSNIVVFDQLYDIKYNENLVDNKPLKSEVISNPVLFSTREIVNVKDKGWKKEGIFKLIKSSDEIVIIEGNFKNNLQDGLWKTYFYEQGVYLSQNFVLGKGELEKYFKISNNVPFSGRLEISFQNDNTMTEIKISEGLRHGKTKYFDELGNLIKTEKYSKGILQD